MSCDDCFKTVPHTGNPVGHTETIAGVPTYVSKPRAGTTAGGVQKIILFFSDVFSPFYINNQLLQDWYASFGYIVLGIDYFFGDRLEEQMKEPGFDRESWRIKSLNQAVEHTPRWVNAVREQYGADAKYCAVGYCFGAPYVFELANDPTFNLVAAAVAHPSQIYDRETNKLKRSVIQNIVAPIAFGCAETDAAFPTEARREAEDILVEKKARYYFQIFSGVSHGFGTRGDPADPIQKFAKEECARGFLYWFNQHTA